MGCRMTIPKCKLYSPLLNIATLGLALISTLLQAIAFSSHGWAKWTDFEKDVTGDIISVENSVGLWYSVVCKTGRCETISHHDGYMKDVSAGVTHREVQYSLRIWSQTLFTLGLSASVVASLLSVPFLCQSNQVRYKRLTLGVGVFSFISCCLVTAVIANWGAEQIATRKLHQDLIFETPWSLLVGGFGGALSGTLGVFFSVVLCLTLDSSSSGTLDSDLPNVYIPLMHQVSTASQFSSESNTNSRSVRNNSHVTEKEDVKCNSPADDRSNPPDLLDN